MSVLTPVRATDWLTEVQHPFIPSPQKQRVQASWRMWGEKFTAVLKGSNMGVGEQGCQLALPASLVHWPLPGEYWRADHCVKNYLSLPFIPSQAISLFIYLFLYFETRSPQITYADLEFKMCLPQSLKDWDYRRVHHTQLACFLSGGQRSGGRELPLPPLHFWGYSSGAQGQLG